MMFTVTFSVGKERHTEGANIDARSKDEVEEILAEEYYPEEVSILNIRRTIKNPNTDLAMED